ncbi:hypothetical protein [Polyangium sorediatum]|uniref:Uncharacterized protein n=1 Tax=Polyangium sorediatum TaxID=889274 RepID=A0ABT6NML0_9BACT|nr:hypothetical protein [Polyangium sorediatum]MDI1429566.1 hypothetical protein [Polyangium sorediatum]
MGRHDGRVGYRRRAKATLEKGAWLSIALSELACSPAPAPTPPASSTPTETVAPASPTAAPAPSVAASTGLNQGEEEILQKFMPYAVTDGSIARRVLFTWTTREQIAALEKAPVLLTRAESPEHGASYFDQLLHARALAKDPLAQMLRTTPFARARYAWTAPWATTYGLGGESYGDQLLRVTLKPEAWIAVLMTSKKALDVRDLAGKPVPIADALAHPERIAAVYFVHDTPKTGYAASLAGPEERVGYREYVLCNESMIESWSLRTPEIRKELLDSAAALRALARHLFLHPPERRFTGTRWNVHVVTETFPLAAPVPTLLGAYEASLAFPFGVYEPEADRLNTVATRVEEYEESQKGPPLMHTPTATFPPPSARKPSPPPRIVRRYGTY